jgi:hypothetical protein
MLGTAGGFSLIPRSHVVGVTDFLEIGTGQYASLTGPTSAPQRPMPSTTYIKHAGMGVEVVVIVVNDAHGKIRARNYIDLY